MVEGLVVERAGQKIGVLADGKIYRAIPLGKVRKKEKIYAGDKVFGKVVGSDFVIEKVSERKNLIPRPPIANVDRIFLVVTIKEPPFQNFLLDNLLVVYHHFGVDSVIVFNKIDILEDEEKKELERWSEIYSKIGYTVLQVSAKTGEGIDSLENIAGSGISVFAGPSGVGKSSLVSALTGESLRIGEVSEKTERGKHTTREVKLIRFKEGFIGDSPGFSRVEALNFMDKKEVARYFPEFLECKCKFSSCLHLGEEGCEVIEKVKSGEISCERYKSYLKMLKTFADWLSEVEGCKD